MNDAEHSAMPARIASQEGAFGDVLRSAIRYTPALDQTAAFRALVERTRTDRLIQRPSLVLAFAVVCLALVAGVALWPHTRIHVASRTVVPAEAFAPTPMPTPLAAGDTKLDDGTRVHLERQSSARVEKTARGARVDLEYGSIVLEVARQNSGRTLEVRSSAYRFVVLGTAFTVSSSPERVELEVREGRVAVFREQTRLAELGAGETWSSEDGAAKEPPPTTPPAVPSGAAERDNHAASEPHPAGESTADVDCLGLARAGRARDAERCFAEQAAGGGLRAELALSELARLRSDVLGDPASALQALEQYRARFPSGSLRAEVDLSYVHLLDRLSRSHELLAETDRLLGSGSAREREGELRMLRANTLRNKLGNLAAAEREYAAVEGGGGRFSGEATYYRAVCLEGLGDTRAAADAYRRYVGVPGRQREAAARKRLAEIAP